MLEDTLSQTNPWIVVTRLGCTHLPTMSKFANTPPNS